MEFAKLTYDDLQFLNEVRNECAAEFLHNSSTFTLEQTQEWFDRTNPDFWIIWENGERIGYFRTSEWSLDNKNCYVGADLHKNFRSRGLAYEAYIKFLPFLFNYFALHKISLEVLETNERAIKLYEKIGFVREGIKREEVLKNDMWINSIIMSILENELK